MKAMVTALALVGLAGNAAPAGELVLQLKWLPQVQFAGYYVAMEKGFYRAEGVDVAILPGGPDIAPARVLAEGRADVIVEWLPAALAAREKGLPLVNIAQPFQGTGMMLACLREAGVEELSRDLPGKVLGGWFQGNEYALLNWIGHLDLPAAQGPHVVPQGSGVEALLKKQALCITAMSYNEIDQLAGAGLGPEALSLFAYADQPGATLEDGLYVLEGSLRDPGRLDDLAGFLRASMKGWRHAEAHPDEAARIVARHDPSGRLDTDRQARMMAEVARLTAGSDGRLDEAAYQRSVDSLLAAGPATGITKPPQGAFTHQIIQRARLQPFGPNLPQPDR